MGTVIRAEISTNNRYWVEKHRYYELKHFCFQYPEWKKRYRAIDGLGARACYGSELVTGGTMADPTSTYAEARLYYRERMELVEAVAREAAGDLASYLLRGVTEQITFEKLNARERIPCSRDAWYAMYRRFFWLLDRARK